VNRDIQFKGFAKALWDELETNIDFIPESAKHRATFLPIVEGIIARRAYDLVEHTLDNATSRYDMDVIYHVDTIPDLTSFEPES
jgi:hypothetical protein